MKKMTKEKTTYVLLIIIGSLSIAASIFLYFKNKSFDSFLYSILMGIVFTGTGVVYLRKLKSDESKTSK